MTRTTQYNLAAIRELLLAAFTAEELRRFCLDRPAFRPNLAEFGPAMGLDDMVDRVIDYCRTRFLFDELLSEIKLARPRRYARHEPYTSVSRTAPQPSPATLWHRPSISWPPIVVVALLICSCIMLMTVWWALKLPPFEPTQIPLPTRTVVLTLSAAPTATAVPPIDSAVMVYVPAGVFSMGSTNDDPDAHDNEKPQHEVTLGAFWIDRTGVTNAQYRRCVEDEECSPPDHSTSQTRISYYAAAKFDDYPVINVDWEQANAYCTWAGKRLPTEAEWEKAARGTDGLIYPWGDTFDGRLLNFCDVNCREDWRDEYWDDGYTDTAPVGSYEDGASPYGALDMVGNVWTWTSSLFQEYPYQSSDGREDLGANGTRVLRGGSWYHDQGRVRAAYRGYYDPTNASLHVGFRCARSDSQP